MFKMLSSILKVTIYILPDVDPLEFRRGKEGLQKFRIQI